jgi:NTE family protein
MADTATHEPIADEVSVDKGEQDEKGEEGRWKTALILGGGSPHMTLMAGALVALDEEGIEFHVISTSGAGALIGLLYTVPKCKDRRQALRDIRDVGVSDLIYELLPVNYKVFFKKGRVAELYRALWNMNPLVRLALSQSDKGPWQRQASDWVKMLGALTTPTFLNYFSKGVCAPVPFIDDLVDFDRLQDKEDKNLRDLDLYMNAYNVTKRKLENFGKKDINREHFLAALSYPFIYDPTTLCGNLYYEGAATDCLNFKFLVGKGHGFEPKHPEIERLVVFDIIGNDRLLHRPRNLWDAWGQSIIYPLVEIAKDDLKIFECVYNVKTDGQGRLQLGPDGKTQQDREVFKVKFDIPDEFWPEILDWSNTNVNRMYDFGYAAGKCHAQELKEKQKATQKRRQAKRGPAGRAGP